MELRRIYDWRNPEEAGRTWGPGRPRWSKRYPKLCNWVEESIEETLSCYGLPRQHHKPLKSTNLP